MWVRASARRSRNSPRSYCSSPARPGRSPTRREAKRRWCAIASGRRAALRRRSHSRPGSILKKGSGALSLGAPSISKKLRATSEARKPMAEARRINIAQPMLGEEEWRALREPIETGWLTQGPKVAAFEKAFARRHGVRHALACSSCTTALHLMLAALEIGPGDEVIVPAFTWVATANAVIYCGATPVLVDVDRTTFNLDPVYLKAKLSPRTRAIVAVHLFGLCADMEAIAAAAPGIPILEDAACAAGSSYLGQSAGSLGRAAAFSFHPRKSITTGEGGMVTTNDDAL